MSNSEIRDNKDPAGFTENKQPVWYRHRSRIAVAAALFLLIYIPSAFNWFRSKPVATGILRDGALSESIYTQALVIRDESMIIAETGGVYVPTVNDGERVPGNFVIASAYEQMPVELIEELGQINLELLRSQYEAQERSPVYLQSVEGIESDIKDIVKKMIPEINRNSLADAQVRADDIEGLVLRRAEAYAVLDTDDPYVNDLKSQKRVTEEQVAGFRTEARSITPGHISFTWDGMEDILNPNNIESLAVSDFEALYNESENAHYSVSDYTYGGIAVESGEAYARVVKGNEFLLAVKAPADYAARHAVGERIRIRVDVPYCEYENAEIVAIREENSWVDGYTDADEDTAAEDSANEDTAVVAAEDSGGECLVFVRLTKYLFEFLDARSVNVALIERRQEGLKVPVKSLRNFNADDSSAEIVLLNGERASVRKVRVLASSEVNAIIASYDDKTAGERVARYDTYVRDTENIVDGMQLAGD